MKHFLIPVAFLCAASTFNMSASLADDAKEEIVLDKRFLQAERTMNKYATLEMFAQKRYVLPPGVFFGIGNRVILTPEPKIKSYVLPRTGLFGKF